jgi:hypothetical protein
MGFLMVVYCAVILMALASLWVVYTKAGQPGWAAIVPIYNLYVWTKIVGRPWWWMLLMLVPLVNIIIAIILNLDLARSFGKTAAYGVGLMLLGFIFYPMLAFGSSTYTGPSAA